MEIKLYLANSSFLMQQQILISINQFSALCTYLSTAKFKMFSSKRPNFYAARQRRSLIRPSFSCLSVSNFKQSHLLIHNNVGKCLGNLCCHKVVMAQ